MHLSLLLDTWHRADHTQTGPSLLGVPGAVSSTGHRAWASENESSDSDADHPDPDLVLDDLASRRFHSRAPAAPPNFALPMRVESRPVSHTPGPLVTVTNVPRQMLTSPSGGLQLPRTHVRRPGGANVCLYDDSEEDDDGRGRADPVQDDLYTLLDTRGGCACAEDQEGLSAPALVQKDPRIQPGDLLRGLGQRRCSLALPPAPPLTDAQQSSSPPQSSAPLSFEPPDFWPRPDPASGPRLVKCEQCPLRGRENPMDPYNVSADIVPDLENDDMFARRTTAFRSSAELAWLKYGDLLQSPRRHEPCIRVVTPKRDGQPVYPDIERDDVLYRRVQQRSVQRPLSGAPDSYHPVPVPEPWDLPPHLQAKLQCAPHHPMREEPEEEQRQREQEHPKMDDMLVRKLRSGPIQGGCRPTGECPSSGSTQMGPSVPPTRSEEDLQKWQAIREASRLRYKKRLMVERLAERC
ncbi:uncharacterized protein LOC143485832 [Brachyhypopomus gauderio]|uniref:uncharacterized protein LOC143485832 n=1 Tax=Brachyhypopomus gauderio TaxID=698409 RepID=UPI004040FF9A